MARGLHIEHDCQKELELVPGTTEFTYIRTLVSNSSNNCGISGARDLAKCFLAIT